MPLERRTTSRWWYGRYEVNGKRYCVNLDIEIAGVPPEKGQKFGNPAYERARGNAETKLAQIISDTRRPMKAEALVQQLHEIKYGATIKTYPVDKLVAAWKSIPKRNEALHPRYVSAVEATIRDFEDHLKKNHPDVKEAAQVSRTIARTYMQSAALASLAAKSWNDVLKRLKGVFRFLQVEYGVLHNPFDGIQAREENHIHRKPFTTDEVAKLLEVAKADEFCRPLIVCGLSTAMRRGDCCLLKWTDVTLTGRHPSINVKTGKTGETVIIPIYSYLMDELQRAHAISFGKSEYVWPEQAAMQLTNENGVTYRLRLIFEAAGFKQKVPKPKRKKNGDEQVAENATHIPHKASVRDFHSLRTTWITEALSRGLPIETVKLISGHRTTEVVTQHYFRPNQEQVRDAITAAMPKMLTGGTGEADPKTESIADKMLAIIDGMKPKTWKSDAAELRKLAVQLKAAEKMAA